MTGSNSPLGLFGGRFDPVHRAHIKIAQAVADQLKLDEVRWIVTGSPIHKPTAAAAPHRLRMMELALAELGDPRMVVDDREVIAAAAGKTNYSADSITSFQAEFPGRPLVWILGEDQLEQFKTWSRWDWIIKNVVLAVCGRPNADTQRISNDLHHQGADIRWISLSLDAVSSTLIRERISSGDPIDGLLPETVADYIADQGLYR